MNLVKEVLSNGYILMIPILLWNVIFASKLPAAYTPEFFDKNIPAFILIGENITRFVIFFTPLFFRLNINSTLGKSGLALFVIGMLIYFVSWLLLMYAIDSNWSRSLWGFAAPAYTPLIWLIGLSLATDSFYFPLSYSPWYFIVAAISFSAFHITHVVFVYNRFYGSF